MQHPWEKKPPGYELTPLGNEKLVLITALPPVIDSIVIFKFRQIMSTQ